jgi:hypothetical protein
MPKTYSPRLLQTEAANRRADLELIIRDLEHILQCCDLMLSKHQHPILNFEAAALLDSIAIRYRRCFGSGVRTSLDPAEMPSLQGDATERHEFFWDLANKHVAHSVNGFEMNATVVYVAEDEVGNVSKGGLGSQGSATLELSLHDIRRFGNHVESLLANIRAEHELFTQQVNVEVDAMSEQQLRGLPDGFVPFEPRLNVKGRRQWPKAIMRVEKTP